MSPHGMLGPEDSTLERQALSVCALESLTDNTVTAVHTCGGTLGGGVAHGRESWRRGREVHWSSCLTN